MCHAVCDTLFWRVNYFLKVRAFQGAQISTQIHRPIQIHAPAQYEQGRFSYHFAMIRPSV